MANNTFTFDFGFSAVSEDELKAYERQLSQQVSDKDAELEEVARTYEQKLNTLHSMIMPLLHNLAKDPDKEYILWPDRHKKVNEFMKQVEKVMNG